MLGTEYTFRYGGTEAISWLPICQFASLNDIGQTEQHQFITMFESLNTVHASWPHTALRENIIVE